MVMALSTGSEVNKQPSQRVLVTASADLSDRITPTVLVARRGPISGPRGPGPGARLPLAGNLGSPQAWPPCATVPPSAPAKGHGPWQHWQWR